MQYLIGAGYREIGAGTFHYAHVRARINMDLRQVHVTNLKGIGEKTAKCLSKLGVESVHDLLWYVPAGYIRYPEISAFSEIKDGEIAAIYGTVNKDFFERKNARIPVTTFTVREYGKNLSSVNVEMVFFRQTYLRSIFKPGMNFVFYGKILQKGNKYCMEMPEYCSLKDYQNKQSCLQGVYPLTKGISSKLIGKSVQQSMNEFFPVEDPFDDEMRSANHLLSLSDAFRKIHFPVDANHVNEARNTLVFHEFYDFLSQIEESKKENTEAPSEYIIKDISLSESYEQNLPFALTNAQKKALSEIREDLSSGHCMRRLIQGDVGSGKTLVAFLSMADTAYAGYQAALMAPTEVLATQHFEKFCKENEAYHLGLKPVLLTGSLTAAKKRSLYEGIEKGDYNIVIGTHAIFQEKVNFRNLALVITDEQHRFGVKQRETLAGKGNMPHVLVMSATPIPRTLTLTLYADLKISVMKDMPAKRLPIKSCVIGPELRPSAYKLIKEQIEAGHQAYIICPMVEDNEDTSLESVTSYHEKLDAYFNGSVRYGILHGRMKAGEKNQIMESFAKKEIDVLISTTVVEVGVDVPNATVIIIENAERFGLAGLHQLRGRVGRGDAQSYCIFINGSGKSEQNERLEVLHKSNDGFYIAEEDLRLRGPGDINGIRQSGDMNFRIADIINDYDILMLAKEYLEKHGK